MLKKILFLTIISVLFIIPLSSIDATEPIVITLNQQEFKPGNEIEAKVVFTNNYSKQLKGRLFCNFADLNQKLPPMPYVEEINLAQGQKSKTFIFTMTIGETMPEGIWQAEVEIRDENNNLIVKNYKQFLVTGTKKEINADLLICVDIDCKDNKAVFIKGETVYLKLNTSLIDLQINAGIQDSQTQNQQAVIFNNNVAQVKAEQQASYIINLILNKDGYSEQNIQKNFAVINAPAKIKSASICNADGKCVTPETAQNCPQDCLKSEQAVDKINAINIKIIIAIIAIAIIIAIMTAAYWFLMRKSSKTKTANDEKEENSRDL